MPPPVTNIYVCIYVCMYIYIYIYNTNRVNTMVDTAL